MINWTVVVLAPVTLIVHLSVQHDFVPRVRLRQLISLLVFRTRPKQNDIRLDLSFVNKRCDLLR